MSAESRWSADPKKPQQVYRNDLEEMYRDELHGTVMIPVKQSSLNDMPEVIIGQIREKGYMGFNWEQSRSVIMLPG